MARRFWAGKLLRTWLASLGVLALLAGPVAAKDGLKHVSIAVGGAGCLCYLPTMLAHQIGKYEKAGLDVELINFKGGSQALTAVLGGSADVVSGYYDHCVNLAAKNQPMQAFVTYDRYPGLVLVVSPKHLEEIHSITDLAGKKVGVSAPGSSTDFFLKYLLHKNGVDPNSVAVVGIVLEATAMSAQEQRLAAPTGTSTSPRSRVRSRCIRCAEAWIPGGRRRCSTYSASRCRRSPTPISTWRRPTPTNTSSRRTRKLGASNRENGRTGRRR